MKVDEKGHIHLYTDDFMIIHNKEGKMSLGYHVGMFLEDYREMQEELEKLRKLEALEEINIEELDLCTNCNPFKDKTDGRVQTTLPLEVES